MLYGCEENSGVVCFVAGSCCGKNNVVVHFVVNIQPIGCENQSSCRLCIVIDNNVVHLQTCCTCQMTPCALAISYHHVQYCLYFRDSVSAIPVSQVVLVSSVGGEELASCSRTVGTKQLSLIACTLLNIIRLTYYKGLGWKLGHGLVWPSH